MRIPSGAGKPPVIICLQGHTSGMHISLGQAKNSRDEASISGGDRDFCVRAVREGFAAVALEQRNFGEVGEDGCFESAMTALLSGRTAIGERVWDISRLIDVLEDEFSDIINVQRIGIMGNSGGGTTTVYAAALEDRIKLAMPSCAMCTYRDSIGAMHHCACNYIPRIAQYFDMGDLMAMACPKYFIQVSGREDDIFPLGGAAEAFGAGKKAYDFGASEFNRKMKRITQERLKRGLPVSLDIPNDATQRNLKNSRHSMRGREMVSPLRIDRFS